RRRRRHRKADDAGRVRQTGFRRDREMAQSGGVCGRFRGLANNETGWKMLGVLRAAAFSLACLSIVAVGGTPALAGYPDRPVHWMIGFSAGGPVDTVARLMAQKLSEILGQQFIVENRAGSGGNIATEAAINAAPDGYTVLFSGANNAISATLYKHLNFDFMRDTVPVAHFMQVPNLLVVSNAFPAKTVQEFIDYCKANPGKISFASSATAP